MCLDFKEELSEDILQKQSRAIDQHLFSWLYSLGYSFQKTEEGVKAFLKQRNFELICSPKSDEKGGTIYTYKLARVISETKLHLVQPKITIED